MNDTSGMALAEEDNLLMYFQEFVSEGGLVIVCVKKFKNLKWETNPDRLQGRP